MSKLKKCLEIILRSPITPCIWGKMGTGKSAVVRQIAAENNWVYEEKRLSQVDMGDLVGLYSRNEKTGTAELLPPAFWKRIQSHGDAPGLLFLDELNRAKYTELQGVFSLVEPVLDSIGKRRIDENVLPDSWRVVVACNPDDGNYEVQSFDPALLSRMVHFSSDLDFKSFMDWGTGKLEVQVLNFLNENRNLMEVQGEQINLGLKPTKRGWQMVSTIQATMTEEEVKEGYLLTIASGIIGTEAAVMYHQYLLNNLSKIPDVDDILFHPEKVEPFFKILNQNGEVKSDLINAANTRILQHLNEKIKAKSKKYTTANVAPGLIAYLKNLSKDHVVAFMKEMCDLEGGFGQKWLRESGDFPGMEGVFSSLRSNPGGKSGK